MFKIQVENFQSLAQVEMTVDRFTVVCGTNNSGKSALMRAVRAVFLNTPGHSFVRHGAASTTVTLRFDDAPVLQWQKGEKVKPLYTMGDASIHPGRGTPDELSSYRVFSLDAGGEPTWPQFAPQFTGQIYLLDKSGAAIAEAVADPDQVGRLHQALSAAEKDLRSTKAEIKIRRSDLSAASSKLEEWRDFSVLEAQYEAHRAANAKQAQRVALEQKLLLLSGRLGHARAQVQHLSGSAQLQIPSVEALQETRSSLARCLDVLAKHQRATEAVRRFEGLGELVVPDVGLRPKVAMLAKLKDLEARMQTASRNAESVMLEVKEAESELVLCESAVAEFVPDEVVVCPSCNRPLP